MGLLIGDLARATGVAPSTIRYYESLGLLPKPERSAAGYRTYPEQAVQALLFVRKARALNFALEQIKELQQLCANSRSSAEVLEFALAYFEGLDRRVSQLLRFHERLGNEIEGWRKQKRVNGQNLCALIEEHDLEEPRALPLRKIRTKARRR